MTPCSVREYADAVRGRYFRASKRGKGKILDEFVRVAGWHHKAVIRLLRRLNQPGVTSVKGKRGRPRRYGAAVAGALRVAWDASDHICSKRLQPFLPEMVKVLRRHGEDTMMADIEAQLCRMSPSTIDRLLYPWHKSGGRRSLSTTKSGSLLKNSIPIRTFTDLQDNRPGFLEVDLVAHCGESVDGFYLTTLSTVDVASGWSECVGVWGKGQQRAGAAVHRVRQRLPVSLLGLDSDNGGEFINQHLYNYCRREGINFTRSRSYKKNDSCHVEQKNWSVVRRVIGYQRYSSHRALEALNQRSTVVSTRSNFWDRSMATWNNSGNWRSVQPVR